MFTVMTIAGGVAIFGTILLGGFWIAECIKVAMTRDWDAEEENAD